MKFDFEAHERDRSLFERLGLPTTASATLEDDEGWIVLGCVEIEKARPKLGHCAATVEVKVCCLPAQFYQFVIRRPDENFDSSHEIFRINTGTGSFREFWTSAEMVAANMINISNMGSYPNE